MRFFSRFYGRPIQLRIDDRGFVLNETGRGIGAGLRVHDPYRRDRKLAGEFPISSPTVRGSSGRFACAVSTGLRFSPAIAPTSDSRVAPPGQRPSACLPLHPKERPRVAAPRSGTGRWIRQAGPVVEIAFRPCLRAAARFSTVACPGCRYAHARREIRDSAAVFPTARRDRPGPAGAGRASRHSEKSCGTGNRPHRPRR